MKELGSGLYLGNDCKIYKLVPASKEELESYIILSKAKQASVPVQDRDSAAYTAVPGRPRALVLPVSFSSPYI